MSLKQRPKRFLEGYKRKSQLCSVCLNQEYIRRMNKCAKCGVYTCSYCWEHNKTHYHSLCNNCLNLSQCCIACQKPLSILNYQRMHCCGFFIHSVCFFLHSVDCKGLQNLIRDSIFSYYEFLSRTNIMSTPIGSIENYDEEIIKILSNNNPPPLSFRPACDVLDYMEEKD